MAEKLLGDVLEKMIDCQTANTQALTSLKSVVDDNNGYAKAILKNFHNGFRSEIKEHITKEVEDCYLRQLSSQENIHTKLSEILEIVKTFKTVGFWSKVILGFVTAIGIVAAAVIKIVDLIRP